MYLLYCLIHSVLSINWRHLQLYYLGNVLIRILVMCPDYCKCHCNVTFCGKRHWLLCISARDELSWRFGVSCVKCQFQWTVLVFVAVVISFNDIKIFEFLFKSIIPYLLFNSIYWVDDKAEGRSYSFLAKRGFFI